ncbi:MAG TPA: dihydrofolate reductase [Kineosporiaceae bacterium]|nr:dihydrofolate reductase [Kineosporiaceae bacterium]
MIGLIWAQGAGGVIGAHGSLPWHLPEDLAHFRTVTTGSTVLMGRLTWESLPPRFRPLPGRRNLVLTRQPSWADTGAERVAGIGDALEVGDLWVIGGAQAYAAALPHADRVVRTELEQAFDGDVYAPELDGAWHAVQTVPEQGWSTSRTGLRYRISTLHRSA